MPALSPEAVGEADLRVRAAQGSQRHGRRCPASGEAAGQLECQGEPDRAESGTRNSVRDARAATCVGFSKHRAACTAVFYPQASRSRCLRRLRTVEADGTGHVVAARYASPDTLQTTPC